jgi:uncharacterized protein DUF1360
MATEPATFPQEVRDQQRRPDSPAEPVDYAALSAGLAALITGVAVAARKRGTDSDPITGTELIPLSAAAFSISKAIAREKVGTWVREPFVDEEHGQRPQGRGLRRAVGELVTCTRCVGAWSAAGIVGLRVLSPQTGRVVTSVFAVSAANDFLQAGFKWLCAQSNRAES